MEEKIIAKVKIFCLNNIKRDFIFQVKGSQGSESSFTIEEEPFSAAYLLGDSMDYIDLDNSLHINVIEGILTQEEFDVLVMPYSFTDDFLDFSGLRLAAHVRLTKELGRSKQSVPIIIYGDEDPYLVSKLTRFTNIFGTQGVYWCPYDPDRLNRMFESGLLHRCDDLVKFANRIVISPPPNYDSRHAVANEWSALRWAKATDSFRGSDILQDLDEKFSRKLFFKRLLFLEETTKEDSIDVPKNLTKIKGKVLIMDDQIHYWESILKKIIPKQIDVKFIGHDFTGMSREEIVTKSAGIVKSFDPDVVLLDLRLCDEDFDGYPNDDLTGFRILDEIKCFNRGIQVILFTASSKTWSLEKSLKKGALGYLLKGGPDLANSSPQSTDVIFSLLDLLETGLINAVPQKLIYNFRSDLEGNLQDSINRNSLNAKLKELQSVVYSSSEIIFSELRDKNQLACFSLFSIFEILSDVFIDDLTSSRNENKEAFLYGGKQLKLLRLNKNMQCANKDKFDDINFDDLKKNNNYDINYYFSIKNRIYNIAYYLFDIDDLKFYLRVDKFTRWRNDFVHNNESRKLQIMKDTQMLSYFKVSRLLLEKSLSNFPKELI